MIAAKDSLHAQVQEVLDQHRPAVRRVSDKVLVPVGPGDYQTTCLCGHWTDKSYDEHVFDALAEAMP